MTPTPRLAYFSFDQAPAPKGAAIHIEAFAKALGNSFGPISLITVSRDTESSKPFERWPGVWHSALPATGPTLIDRVLHFRQGLAPWMHGREAIHFRSIYEGFPLLRLNPRPKLVFEVNGMPSIELKYRYPGVVNDRDLRAKIFAQEQCCLHAADLIVTPSAVTSRYLQSRGVEAPRIVVIPNGVDLQLFPERPPLDKPMPLSLVYFGTMASWQGVDLAIRAAAQVQQTLPVQLRLIGVRSLAQQSAIEALIAKLGVNAALCHATPQHQLAQVLSEAHAILAPLAPDDRNTIQGCCPLKILEGMASGTPVIASDLPVVRELGEPDEHLITVKPGSVDQIAQAVLRLAEHPSLGARISQAARRRIEERFQWSHAGDALVRAYHQYGIMRSSTA